MDVHFNLEGVDMAPLNKSVPKWFNDAVWYWLLVYIIAMAYCRYISPGPFPRSPSFSFIILLIALGLWFVATIFYVAHNAPIPIRYSTWEEISLWVMLGYFFSEAIDLNFPYVVVQKIVQADRIATIGVLSFIFLVLVAAGFKEGKAAAAFEAVLSKYGKVPEERVRKLIQERYKGDLNTETQESLITIIIGAYLKDLEVILNMKDGETESAYRARILEAQQVCVDVCAQMLMVLGAAWSSISASGPFRISKAEAFPNMGFLIGKFLQPLFDKRAIKLGMFNELRSGFLTNQEIESAAILSKPELQQGKIVFPNKHPGSPSKIVEAYLHNLPFSAFFHGEASYGWKDPTTRFEHTWVVAPPKSGKTQLLQAMIAHDLPAVERGEASIIVIDSQGQMLNKIARLELFDRVPLTHLNPADDIGINPFSIEDIGTESGNTAAVELLRYVIGSFMDAAMTPKQTGMFRRVIRGLLQTKGATVVTLMRLLKGEIRLDPSRLDSDTRAYFEDTFYKDPSLKETKEQIAWRIDGLLGQSQTVERILSVARSDLNFEQALETPGVTLIHTNDHLMGKDGCAFLGRLCVANIVRAARKRPGLGEDMPVYVYIDEAHDLISNDANVAELLAQIRKYNVGFIFAHQWISQIKSSEVETALSNSGTLIAGRSRDDAARFGKYMNCDPKIITNCKSGEFVVLIRDQNDNKGLKVRVPGFVIENMPQRPWQRPVRERSHEAPEQPEGIIEVTKNAPRPSRARRPTADDDTDASSER